jgi:hypothetical protein
MPVCFTVMMSSAVHGACPDGWCRGFTYRLFCALNQWVTVNDIMV